MATQHNTRVSLAALAAISLALAIGSAPVAALLILSDGVEVLK